METSILITIKKLLGISSTDTSFDTDIIVSINSVFSILCQLGVGPETGFKITGSTETWTQFIGNTTTIELVKTYIYLKVRKMFDPSQSATVANAMDETIKELEWRLNTIVDPGEET